MITTKRFKADEELRAGESVELATASSVAKAKTGASKIGIARNSAPAGGLVDVGVEDHAARAGLSAAASPLEVTARDAKERLSAALTRLGWSAAHRPIGILEAAEALLLAAGLEAKFLRYVAPALVREGPGGAMRELRAAIRGGEEIDCDRANLIGSLLLAASVYVVDVDGGTSIREADDGSGKILVAELGDESLIPTETFRTGVWAIYDAMVGADPDPTAELARLGDAIEGIIGGA